MPGFDDSPDFLELGSKLLLPGEGANGMGSKGNQVRSDSEKKDLMLRVEAQDPDKTIEIVLNRFN